MSLPLTKEQKMITLTEKFGAVMIDHLKEYFTTGKGMRDAQRKYRADGMKTADLMECRKWVKEFDLVLYKIEKSMQNQTPRK